MQRLQEEMTFEISSLVRRTMLLIEKHTAISHNHKTIFYSRFTSEVVEKMIRTRECQLSHIK